jgi:hypothetical protein
VFFFERGVACVETYVREDHAHLVRVKHYGGVQRVAELLDLHHVPEPVVARGEKLLVVRAIDAPVAGGRTRVVVKGDKVNGSARRVVGFVEEI